MGQVDKEFTKSLGASLAPALLFVTVLLSAACSGSGTATSPTTTPTPAPATITEVFTGVLPVGGSKFYSLSIAVYGTVTATLTDVGGAGVPASVMLNLGIGTPSGTTCSAGATPVQLSGTAQVSTLVTANEAPGVYCVQVSDIGNLFAPATFTVTIDHP